MKPLVQKMLTRKFLVEYATYTQTCAHLELACWEIVRFADGSLEDDPIKADKYLKVRKVSTHLRDHFRAAADKVSSELADRIIRLSNRIEEGIENRNTAVHGAWFTDETVGGIWVQHYFRRNDDPQYQWRHFDSPFSQETVDAAIKDADEMLREAINIRTALKDHPA